MRQQLLASVARIPATTGWSTPIVPALTVLIYGILAPAVFLTILIIGVELAWPGGTKLRHVMYMTRPVPPRAASRLRAEPHFRTLCAVGGLIAVAVWSIVMTTWLAGYLRASSAPQLAAAQATTGNLIIFLIMLAIGLYGGYAWARGMYLATDAQTSMTVIATSLSLAGTVLFFYLVEPPLHDMLLVVALGVFVGVLTVAARHPTLLTEGLFAELLTPNFVTLPYLTADDGSDVDLDHEGEITDTVDAAGWRTHPADGDISPQALIGAGPLPVGRAEEEDPRDPSAAGSPAGTTGDRP
jgi:hypothetical protein